MTESLATSILVNSFSGMLGNLASKYIERKTRKIRASHEDLQKWLKPSLESTFNKCIRIKTLLNKQAWTNFLSIYVNQNFSCGDSSIDGYDLIDKIRVGENCVISGTGGGGKSMFMRYLWISLFERGDGRIPFFVELRNINQFSGESLLTYLYHSITQTRSIISERDFLDSASQGEFIFLLDGFDEVFVEKRNFLERQIIQIAENNPKLTLVVSGRPDTRFEGWQQFHTYDVKPLTRNQTIELIQKSEYDEVVKQRFINKILGKLFSTHKSFLSNPLLACMMLLAYDLFNDIPEKMYLFYEQAFDALYQKHDGAKGGFARKFHTSLAPDDFRILLSYFCLITYYEEKFEFSEIEIISYLKKANTIYSIDVDIACYLKDIVESICVIQKEGLTYVFTHRSFQEYFAAYCIARVTDRRVEAFFSKFARRHNDQVIKMVYDMNKDLVIAKYALPVIAKFGHIVRKTSNEIALAKFFKEIGGRFLVTIDSKSKIRRNQIILEEKGELSDFLRNMERLFPNTPGRAASSELRRRDDRATSNLKAIYPTHKQIEITITGGDDGFNITSNTDMKSIDLSEWFMSTGMHLFIKRNIAYLSEIIRKLHTQSTSVDVAIEEIFGF